MPRELQKSLTIEQVDERLKELASRAEIEGYVLVAAAHGKVIAMWGADTETAALACGKEASDIVTGIFSWVARGGMRPDAQTH